MKPRIYFRDRYWRVNLLPRGPFGVKDRAAWAQAHSHAAKLNNELHDPANNSPLAIMVRETSKRADDLRKAEHFQEKAKLLMQKAEEALARAWALRHL
jgi:hypothetical protein